MEFFWILAGRIINHLLLMILFSKVSGRKIDLRMIVFGFLLRFGVLFVFEMINQVVNIEMLGYLIFPFYMIIFSFCFLKTLSWTLMIFYALFPITLWNLFYRATSFFILPMLGFSYQISEYNLTGLLFDSLATILAFLFLGLLHYDFTQLKTELFDERDKRLLLFANWGMLTYYLVIQILTYFQYETAFDTIHYREFLVLLCLILFIGLTQQLDQHLRERLQEKLDFQKELQLNHMESYSRQIEDLYKEIRGFRHDYANLLSTLSLGIEKKDLTIVEEVYQSVLKDSNKQFRHQKYEVGRLVHIQDSATKSLLSSKLMEAKEKGIAITLEVPQEISPQGMSLADFIIIVSILCDNAIEACPDQIRIAYFATTDGQQFIIENTIQEESIDLSQIYNFGTSTKGQDRGIGLYNIMKIIERYPTVSIKTSSRNYTFCQILEMRK